MSNGASMAQLAARLRPKLAAIGRGAVGSVGSSAARRGPARAGAHSAMTSKMSTGCSRPARRVEPRAT